MLTDHQLQAIAILKLDPTTPNERLAERVGVSPRTIYNWKQTKAFKEALQIEPEEHLANVLFLKAAQGDTRSLEVWMKMYGRGEKQTVDQFAEALGLSEADLEQIARDCYEYVKSRAA